jgi:hypothetical protein
LANDDLEAAMKVSLAKYGGLAAGVFAQRPPLAVDSATLPAAAAEELARLVAALEKDEPKPPSGRGADVMSYLITVEDERGERTFRATDLGSSPAFKALQAFLSRQ